MKNVTISMDEDTLRWVRIEAAKAGQSVSRWVAAQLQALNHEQAEKAAASAAIEAFLDTFPGIPLSENGKITIDRDEMYEHLLRRHDDPDLSTGWRVSAESSAMPGVAEGDADKGLLDP